jgi:hypothetical protein
MKLKRILFGLTLLSVLFVVGAFAQSKSAKSHRTTANTSPSSTSATSASKIDVNSASEKELDTLPGVGPATAKKIVSGRPYTSVSDLSRAGLNQAAIQKIAPLVQVGNASPSSSAPAASQNASSPHTKSMASNASATSSTPSATQAPGGGPGMVWVNKDTKIYHRQGDRWYGKTKHGEYMTEADAVKAGYHDSKQNAGKR